MAAEQPQLPSRRRMLGMIGGLVLMASGVIDNFSSYHTVTTLSGAHQTIVGGPVASQEVIKELGTNGGGFYNANSAHPFENPNGFTNWLQIYLMLVISVSLPRTFGTMVADRRQGYAIIAVMALIWAASVAVITINELHKVSSTAGTAASGMIEGKEQRFGIVSSSEWAAITTAASNGSVNSAHDSYTGIGGTGAIAPLEI